MAYGFNDDKSKNKLYEWKHLGNITQDGGSLQFPQGAEDFYVRGWVAYKSSPMANGMVKLPRFNSETYYIDGTEVSAANRNYGITSAYVVVDRGARSIRISGMGRVTVANGNTTYYGPTDGNGCEFEVFYR